MDYLPRDRSHEERQRLDWADQYRALIPRPEPEDWVDVRAWDGELIRRIPVRDGDYRTWLEEPWKL